MNRADYIRSLSDDELAQEIYSLNEKLNQGTMNDLSDLYCDGKAGCITKRGNIRCNAKRENACVLRWLLRERKDDA